MNIPPDDIRVEDAGAREGATDSPADTQETEATDDGTDTETMSDEADETTLSSDQGTDSETYTDTETVIITDTSSTEDSTDTGDTDTGTATVSDTGTSDTKETDTDTFRDSGTDSNLDTSTETSPDAGAGAPTDSSTGTDTASSSETGFDADTASATASSFETDTPSDTATVVDLDAGLAAYYPFNGNADDESGNGNHGTVLGPSLTSDRFGNPDSAYHFGGRGAYINCGNGDSIRLTGAVSISAWVRIDNFTARNQGIVAKWSGVNPANQRAYVVHVNNQTNPHSVTMSVSSSGGCIAGGSETCAMSSGMTSTTENTWYHVVAVFDPGVAIKVYLDGQLDGENTAPTTSSVFDSSVDLVIGVQYSMEDDAFYFSGLIDDVRIYNRVLTEAEIDDLYREGGWPSNN